MDELSNANMVKKKNLTVNCFKKDKTSEFKKLKFSDFSEQESSSPTDDNNRVNKSLFKFKHKIDKIGKIDKIDLIR